MLRQLQHDVARNLVLAQARDRDCLQRAIVPVQRIIDQLDGAAVFEETFVPGCQEDRIYIVLKESEMRSSCGIR